MSEILTSSVALNVAILHLLYENLKRSKRPVLSTLHLNESALDVSDLYNLVAISLQSTMMSFIHHSSPSSIQQNKTKMCKVTAIPEIISNVLSVRLQFCDRFSSDRDERSLIFFTPASVNPPPHISKERKFLKPIK